jgi:hypothetical protein
VQDADDGARHPMASGQLIEHPEHGADVTD